MVKTFKILTFFLILNLFLIPAWAADENSQPQEELSVVNAPLPTAEVPVQTTQEQPKIVLDQSLPSNSYADPLRYTLGPDDVVDIIVMRHPEFSGVYPINLEGKIQYKFVGDLDATGLTKKELEKKISDMISNFVVNPEVNVTIVEYKSKVIYVLGEVGAPGKYYMRSEAIPVREAVVQAGLPTLSAAMRRCRLVTPDKNGKMKTKAVDIYSILYGGDLKNNIDMKPGDVLYVPATVMAKIMQVINPVAQPVMSAAGGVRSATTMTP